MCKNFKLNLIKIEIKLIRFVLYLSWIYNLFKINFLTFLVYVKIACQLEKKLTC